MGNKNIKKLAGELQKQEDKTKSLIKTDPLSGIELSEEKQQELLLETFGEALVERIPLFGSKISYTQKYQGKVDSARLALLLSKFEERMESFEAFRSALRRFFASNAGSVLFNKVVRIVNAGNFKQEYIELLAKTLKQVSDSDFEDMFDEHDYALSQVEKLSPQALIVLSDFDAWRNVALQRGTTVSGQTLMGDWDVQATTLVALSRGIEDGRKKTRITHAFRELESNGVIHLSGNKKVELSPIGLEVYQYIS